MWEKSKRSANSDPLVNQAMLAAAWAREVIHAVSRAGSGQAGCPVAHAGPVCVRVTVGVGLLSALSLHQRAAFRASGKCVVELFWFCTLTVLARGKA